MGDLHSDGCSLMLFVCFEVGHCALFGGVEFLSECRLMAGMEFLLVSGSY